MKLARHSALSISIAVLALAFSAGAASAASSPFGCRASAARVELGGSTLLEPLVANPNDSPCADDARGVAAVSVPTGSPALYAGPAAAYTAESSTPSGAALASVDGVTIPTASGDIVAVGPLYAEAYYECSAGNVTSSAFSTLNLLYINGTPVTITPGQGQTIQLGGGSYIDVNEKIATADSLTERILDVHLAGLADIVVGEAEVSRPASNPCPSGGSTTPPLNICPTGSTYNAASGLCEIILPGGGVIIISRPFQGPTGGTVISLAEARKLYRSACLYGPGPNYVIVSKKAYGHVQGTYHAERFLALGGHETVKGGGGNDCIAGPGGNDYLQDANGNVRIYAGPGHNKIPIRNGNDKVWGGSGKNKISAGRGNDHIYGRSGYDIVYVDNGPKHVWVGTRGGKVYAPGARDAIACNSKRGIVNVNKYAARYASHHGCVTVHKLTPATL